MKAKSLFQSVVRAFLMIVMLGTALAITNQVVLAKGPQLHPSLSNHAPALQTTHCGTINSNETWSNSGNVHVVNCDVTVAPGVTLTIQPGAIVKFSSGISLFVQGSLRVLGTNGSPVYLTSIKDDAIGGDTNGDGAGTTPAPGNWSRIEFQDGSDDANSLIDHAVIRYGGSCCYSGDYGAVILISASPTIQNTALVSNAYYAIRADLNSFPTLVSNTYTNNGINGLALQGGTISSNTSWNMTDTAYFIIDDISVENGATLTVNPGAVVKFDNSRSLLVQGALRVLGTAGSPVYLTSGRDDAVKGDTNNDGSTAPSAGDWKHIEFQDGSDDANSLIDHAIIRYGGSCCYSGDYGAVTLISASPTIQNTALVSNAYYAIRADLNSFPTLVGNTYTNNGINGLALQGGTISSNSAWNMTDTAYFIIDDISVENGATLTINPGVVVKFNNSKSLLVQGTLRVLGTAGNPVYLTSGRDDAVKGDTNNDGSTAPSPGDWRRIEFQDGSDDANSLIDHAVIRYGGGTNYYDNYGGITLVSASPTIQNSTITASQYYGISTSNSAPTLGCNNIYSNNSYGLYNATTGTIVNATSQWWGSAKGPYHPTTNPAGTGNAVSNGVSFKPFRNSPCTPPTQTLTFQSQAANDGWVLESSETSNAGGTLNSTATTFNLGDNATRKQYRGILSFSTGSLPDNAVITGVTLKVRQQAIVGGGNPVTMFQGFMFDIKNGFFGTAATLQTGDFQAAGSATYGPSSLVPVGGWYSFNMIGAKAYINKLSTGSGLTQIRLRFKLDDNNNTIANYLRLYSGNAPAGSQPQLVITYYVP